MSKATIHFSSGKTREIGIKEFNALPVKLNARGIRTMVDRDDERTLMIPLNSSTIEFIEQITEQVKEPEVVVEELVTDKTDELKTMKEELEASMKEVEAKKDVEEKEEDQMKLMMQKSNCTHPEETMVIYRHDTAKGSRYFPVCSFCGKRERYVKADSLSDEVKEAAKIWED